MIRNPDSTLHRLEFLFADNCGAVAHVSGYIDGVPYQMERPPSVTEVNLANLMPSAETRGLPAKKGGILSAYMDRLFDQRQSQSLLAASSCEWADDSWPAPLANKVTTTLTCSTAFA